MNITATLEKLTSMRLNGFVRAYRNFIEHSGQYNFTNDELIALLVDAEYEERYNKKMERLIKHAKFKQQACFEQLDFAAPRGLDKNFLFQLQQCDWIKKSRDLIITGLTGTGKSFIACALGFQACVNEYKVAYFTANNLLDQLMFAKADGSYFKILNSLSKTALLIIDDFGLRKIDQKQCTMLLDIIDDRHGNMSTLITSQLPVKAWYDCFSEPTIADAVLDRLVNGSYRIELFGESMRKKLKKNQ